MTPSSPFECYEIVVVLENKSAVMVVPLGAVLNTNRRPRGLKYSFFFSLKASLPLPPLLLSVSVIVIIRGSSGRSHQPSHFSFYFLNLALYD